MGKRTNRKTKLKKKIDEEINLIEKCLTNMNIKKVISIPVILTGGITEADAAEKLLSAGKADLVGIGRAMFRDSKWAKNAIDSFR